MAEGSDGGLEDLAFSLSGLDGSAVPGHIDAKRNLEIVNEEWDAALPALQEFIRIPNLTPAVDPEWATNGLLRKAADHVAKWAKAQNVVGCSVEVLDDDGYSPLLFIEVEGTKGSPKAAETFLMYGHLDKMPHGEGWAGEGSEPGGPLSGTLAEGKYGLQLFGRGAIDDGYAVFGCMISVKALQRQVIDHPRMIIIAECSEESGSPHLPYYIQKLEKRIRKPSVVFCLDSLAEDYNRLWLTTSLRGVLMGILKVGILEEGFHSGVGGGIVPDAFRVVRQLLARIEDVNTGRILVPELQTKVPLERQQQMQNLATELGPPHKIKGFPWREGAQPADPTDAFEQLMDNMWRPCMTVVGAQGLPEPPVAGNVLHPEVSLKLSFRIPPLVDNDKAAQALKEILEKDPPYGATVSYEIKQGANGWNCPEIKENLEVAVATACEEYFDGKHLGFAGGGATIPLLEMLQQMFPSASLLCTGACGPDAKMHGPNEMLNVGYTKKFTACISMILGIVDIQENRDLRDWEEMCGAQKTCSPCASPLGSPRGPRSPRLSLKLSPNDPRYCFRRPDIPVGVCMCCL